MGLYYIFRSNEGSSEDRSFQPCHYIAFDKIKSGPVQESLSEMAKNDSFCFDELRTCSISG